MKFNTLGNSDISVSEICLGSMTWGTQNSEQEGHEQIDYALDQGVNFIDTAELYPTTPTSKETQGRTEEIIGTWFAKGGQRDKVVLASKVTGVGFDYIQDGKAISAAKIRASIEGSLKRLQTDYIDLYQLHWPNRGSYHFRQNWSYDPSTQDSQKTKDDILEALQTLQTLIAEGKIREIGLSNETCWGTSQYLQIARELDLPQIVSIQNEYSLLCRLYDLDLAELSHHENVGLLAYSPLSAGMLSGKYRHGKIPDGSRRSLNKDLFGRYNELSITANDAYIDLAAKHAIDPSQLALAFCLTRPFMASVIIGATTMEQLRTNIASAEVCLSDEILKEIASINRKHPLPI